MHTHCFTYDVTEQRSLLKALGQVQFSVSDNGVEIHPDYFNRIFMIFQRLHSPTAYSGTGIGLSICKKIVELHDDNIWLESEPDKGTTFHFTLPAASVVEQP